MNPILKWIGGATAATMLVFGGATLAGTLMETPTPQGGADEQSTAIDTAIPVDPARLPNAGPAEGGDGATLEPAALDGETTEAQLDHALADAANAMEAGRGEARLQQASASSEQFTVKSILPIEGPIKYGEWHWDASRAPAGGKIVMTVDLDARVISVFKGGHEIGASAVLLGTDKHPTPLGTFPILYKMRHNVSEKYNNAPMPYSMFLTRTGIALHGSEVENGYASHGCVGMPDDFAAKVFAVAKKGDKVIITKGETLSLGEKII